MLATNKVPSQPEVITQTQPPPVAAPPPAEPAGKKTGKKKKKKKRTTLANEGNPHHVDKCECCAQYMITSSGARTL